MTELDTVKRARGYMDMLARGIDPISGQAVPGDSVLNQARLGRCFSYVAGILCKELGPDGKNRNVPTREGLRLGVSAQLRQSQDGDYLAVYYDPNAQRFLLDHLYAILQT